MWYSIGYEQLVDSKGKIPTEAAGSWRIITGPQTTPRSCALALGKALVTARGASPSLRGVYAHCEIVPEDALSLYGLFPRTERLGQTTFAEVEE